jgi:hypothetical protein
LKLSIWSCDSPDFLITPPYYYLKLFGEDSWVLMGTRQLGPRTSRPVREDKSARMLRQLGPYEKTTRTINNYCCQIVSKQCKLKGDCHLKLSIWSCDSPDFLITPPYSYTRNRCGHFELGANIASRVFGNSVQTSYLERFHWLILNFWTLQSAEHAVPCSVAVMLQGLYSVRKFKIGQ